MNQPIERVELWRCPDCKTQRLQAQKPIRHRRFSQPNMDWCGGEMFAKTFVPLNQVLQELEGLAAEWQEVAEACRLMRTQANSEGDHIAAAIHREAALANDTCAANLKSLISHLKEQGEQQ